jgi:hypothetical protein
MSASMIMLGTRGVPNQHGGFESLAEHLLNGYENLGLQCSVIGNHNAEGASPRIG